MGDAEYEALEDALEGWIRSFDQRPSLEPILAFGQKVHPALQRELAELKSEYDRFLRHSGGALIKKSLIDRALRIAQELREI